MELLTAAESPVAQVAQGRQATDGPLRINGRTGVGKASDERCSDREAPLLIQSV